MKIRKDVLDKVNKLNSRLHADMSIYGDHYEFESEDVYRKFLLDNGLTQEEVDWYYEYEEVLQKEYEEFMAY